MTGATGPANPTEEKGGAAQGPQGHARFKGHEEMKTEREVGEKQVSRVGPASQWGKPRKNYLHLANSPENAAQLAAPGCNDSSGHTVARQHQRSSPGPPALKPLVLAPDL